MNFNKLLMLHSLVNIIQDSDSVSILWELVKSGGREVKKLFEGRVFFDMRFVSFSLKKESPRQGCQKCFNTAAQQGFSSYIPAGSFLLLGSKETKIKAK